MKRRGFLAALFALAAAPAAALRGRASEPGGTLRSFGPGTPAMLHGYEEVMTRAELERLTATTFEVGR